ncbi:Potassium efflux system KefA protein / Small-conductance mechanosensitive channel [Rhodovulum sp. PH10]|uniref:mechanosensitive ion channel family protein n=1 Tax=Rhodovulum sp. PH10 TaxID=1187851 RepID=UPI00027C1FAA|nr:mechanosensitive ion channel family protein [Rhodovulum sp. PH10]EJW13272.1 Potassium efflux system KefA protein / Small-conductance mechanosensitive channel [Rhodovulum sp. PH10]
MKSPAGRLLAPLLLLLVVLGAAPAWSQAPATGGNGKPAAAAPAAPEKDPLGRETPQGMVSGLMNALAAGDYDRAVQFFQIDKVSTGRRSSVSGADLAKLFQQVLDRSGIVITPAQLSNDPAGTGDDGLAEGIERFGVVKNGDEKVPLLANRIERDGKQLWFVSDTTLQDVPDLARALSRDTSGMRLIDLVPEGPTIAGAPASHWASLLVAVIAAYALAWFLIWLRRPIGRLIRKGPDSKVGRFVEAAAGPVRIMLTLVLFGISMQFLGVSVIARYRVVFAAQIIGWFAIAWLLWRLTDAASEVVLGRMSRHGQLTAYSIISFLNRAFKAVLVVVFLATLLRAFGVNVTAGLAALGVGGLAIALGAQKLFENLIGSVTLIADRPVRIGDFCRFGTALGTIEEIGIRSTRIRTLDRTVLTVPNGEFASLHIENFSQRDRFWFHPVLNLRYETTPDQIREVVSALHTMLLKHPKVDGGSARARFIALNAYSLDVEIFSYVLARDFNHFLEIQEELLLKCMEIVAACGTGFAFPSQTLYLGRDGVAARPHDGAAPDRSAEEHGKADGKADGKAGGKTTGAGAYTQ